MQCQIKTVAIASPRGIGEQVTQITTQQGRPQIRILVTCGQVVNAYQNDREQDEDLTQKDYFLFRTHGTEHMQRSTVLFALRVSTVLCCCYILLFFLFYDGGGGEVSCCCVLCHFSNKVSPYARLVFIVEWTSALAPIQLLNLEGRTISLKPNHFTKASVHLPTLRRCSTDSTRYTLSTGTDTFCSS